MILEEVYRNHKGLLFGIAYRMLGSVTDAEDIVQEVFLSLSKRNLNHIIDVKAFLVKMTTNRCINLLQSSSRQRESYLGPWLPEPMLDASEELPEKRVERKEQVQYALLVILQTLTPQERALFILKEIVGYSYRETAEMLERTESNCRKIMSRAKQKVKQSRQEAGAISSENDGKFVETFMIAIKTGEFESLKQILLKDVQIITDGGGKVRAALRPIIGYERVLAFIKGIKKKGAFVGEMTPIMLNGEMGVQLIRHGRVIMRACFQTDSSAAGISRIYVVMNPNKLQVCKGVS